MFELRGVSEGWHGFMIDALGECGEAAARYLEERNTVIWQTSTRLAQ